MSETGSLAVLVLGPVVIRSGDDTREVPRLLERALLARLALAKGSPVPDDRLAADLWGEQDLARPTERLRVLASRLRGALGEHAAALRRTPGGYSLDTLPADLVEARTAADRLHAAARAGDHEGVRAAAAQALRRWRGSSLEDLRTIPYARAEAERLDAWHLDLHVERLAAELELGGTAEPGHELARLAAEHPLHERLHRLLALALYRGGRQADALDRLARLRHALAEDLGVDPAPETSELEVALLRQDPALSRPRPATMPPVAPPGVTNAVPGAAADQPGPTDGAQEPSVQLPRIMTSFVGRDDDLAALKDRLTGPVLVTLVGGPGSGKSRLALEAARAVAGTGRAVVLVELAPLGREDAVVPALAAAAGVDGGDGDLLRACTGALRGALLVLDNAEHLIDEVARVVTALYGNTPGLTVLVTSQRPLLVGGEEVRHVGPLGPEAAADLFAQRSLADAASSDPKDVATICAAVDNLPLGVELAAGLTRTLTVSQLAARLHDRLRLLVGGARQSGARHTSLRAALDWSHDLLADRERVVLRRLAAFTGGFDLEAAERVVPDPAGPLDAGDIAPALTELVDRSLVAVEASEGGRRFGLLETVRDYARAKLAEAGELDRLRARHLAWCVVYVRDAGQPGDFVAAEQVAAVFREWPNLLDALENAPGTERAADGLRLALELHTPWLIRGWYAEAGRHFAALTGADGVEPGERVLALSDHGFVSTMAGRLDEAADLLFQASVLVAEIDDDMLAMTVLYHSGIVDIERGRLTDAMPTLLAGEELARKLAHERRLSAFADAIATLHLYAGDAAAAYERNLPAVAADRAAGDEHSLARGLNNEAQALLDLGRTAEAVERAAESDHYARRLDDRQILPLNDVIRGNAALAEGRPAEAEEHLRAAVAYTAGSGAGLTMAHIDLAGVLIDRGELKEAHDLLDAVHREAAEGSIPWLADRPLAAALALASADRAAALRLVDAITGEYAAAGFGWRRYARRLESIRHEST